MCFIDPTAGQRASAGSKSEANRRPTRAGGTRNPFDASNKQTFSNGINRAGFQVQLRGLAQGAQDRFGFDEDQATHFSKFVNSRGGLAAFEGSFQAARQAFSQSGAGTDRAITPKGPEDGGANFRANIDRDRVGASELRGLPLIGGR